MYSTPQGRGVHLVAGSRRLSITREIYHWRALKNKTSVIEESAGQRCLTVVTGRIAINNWVLIDARLPHVEVHVVVSGREAERRRSLKGSSPPFSLCIARRDSEIVLHVPQIRISNVDYFELQRRGG